MKRGKNLAQRLTLPQEVVSQGPLAELHGNTSVCIENHGGILEYTDTRVCIAVQRGTLTVSGCGLRILRMTQRRVEIGGTIRSGGSLEQASGKESSYIEFEYESKGATQRVIYKKIDEYWEYVSYNGRAREYRCFTLYAVAVHPGETAIFDEVTFSRKYGARGLVRSIIPGCGQIYKGSVVKGVCILGGEAALAGGAVAFENMRKNYSKKMHRTQNADHIRSYADKADNCRTFRDVCIGSAAALYLYNLIDALVANGKKRTIVKKSHLSFTPVASPDCNGVRLCYQF